MHRLIRPNKSCQVPSQHIILDTETLPMPNDQCPMTKIHKFRLAVACFFRWERGRPTREKWIQCQSSVDLIKWITSFWTDKRLTWIWAHSAKFDWTSLQLWNHLTDRTITLEYASLDGKPHFLTTRAGKKSAWWIDSCNWWQMSLAKLGESVNLPKLPMPDFTAPDVDWFAYCKRDVEILRVAVVDLLGWIVDNDLGCLRISAPGQAMQAYKHRFAPRATMVLPVKHKNGTITEEPREVCLPITHGVPEVKQLERRAYFQGTVRVNVIGEVKGPVYCLDVNSCYPSVMLDGLVPTRLVDFSCREDYVRPFPLDLIQECIADVKITTSNPDYPLRTCGHCVYPVGTFWTTLPGPELLHAHAKNRILQMGRWARYDLGNLFGAYVRCLWDLRCQYNARRDLAKGSLCKLMLNALGGKFGQRSHRWQKDTEVDWPEPWGHFDIINAVTNEVKHYRSIAWLIERQEPPGEHPESFPAVAAWVTSLARIKMLQLQEVLNGKGTCYYSAVDSIFTNQRGFETLSIGGQCNELLGGLRTDRIAAKMQIRGIANYSIDDTMHVAGLPGTATIGKDQRITVTILTAPIPNDRQSVHNGVVQTVGTRSICPQYVHGRLNSDGITRPWILPLEEQEMQACLKKSPVTNIFA